jgi:hypothetical protein
VIGDIWLDPPVSSTAPKGKWAWYCGIEDYFPFPVAVPAKIDGRFFETIKANTWRNGVRAVPQQMFGRILAAAGEVPEGLDTSNSLPTSFSLPELAFTQIGSTTESLMVPRSRRVKIVAHGEEGGRRGVGWARRSRSAKVVGDIGIEQGNDENSRGSSAAIGV